MAIYTIVASNRLPLAPFEVPAGTIAVSAGDRFILDPSADANVTFTAAAGRPAAFAVEIAESSARSLELKFGQSLAASITIADDVSVPDIRVDAQEAASVHLIAGHGAALGTFRRPAARGPATAAIVQTAGGVEVPCFAAGTQISTAAGAVPIEDLRAGDLVTTLDHAMQPVRWVGSRRLDAADLAARPWLRPVRIRAGALGAGAPHRDLVLSPQHRVLIRSPVAQRMFGTAEILVAAGKLTAIDGIDVLEDVTSVDYWHMLFERHEIVFAEGATSESLLTTPQAMGWLPAAAVDEILCLFPALADPGHRPVQARPIPARAA